MKYWEYRQKESSQEPVLKPNEYPRVELHQNTAMNDSVSTRTATNNNDDGADRGLWGSGPGETAYEGEMPLHL